MHEEPRTRLLPRRSSIPHPLWLLPFALLLASPSPADDGAALASEREKMSYSVGYQVGRDFVRQGLRIDSGLVIRGVEDALAGAEPAMTRDEMQHTLVELQKKVIAAEEGQRQEQASENPTQ